MRPFSLKAIRHFAAESKAKSPDQNGDEYMQQQQLFTIKVYMWEYVSSVQVYYACT